MPSLPEILVKALEDLLDKRDPLRKAERAKARAENSPSSGKEASDEVETETEAVSALASPGNGDQSPTKKSPSRPAIPAATAAAEHQLGTGVMEQARSMRVKLRGLSR